MKVKTKAIISLLVIILFILITNTKVQAKSYYIDDMQIEATVQDNGNLQVEQTLKYAFNGEYNGIYNNTNKIQKSRGSYIKNFK